MENGDTLILSWFNPEWFDKMVIGDFLTQPQPLPILLLLTISSRLKSGHAASASDLPCLFGCHLKYFEKFFIHACNCFVSNFECVIGLTNT